LDSVPSSDDRDFVDERGEHHTDGKKLQRNPQAVSQKGNLCWEKGKEGGGREGRKRKGDRECGREDVTRVAGATLCHSTPHISLSSSVEKKRKRGRGGKAGGGEEETGTETSKGR